MRKAVLGLAERTGRLDILVNNAAAPQGLDRDVIDEIPVEVFDEVIRINLRGTWLMCRAAVPAMRRQRWGRIINISSMAGVIAAPRSTPYSASKAGIIGLTRALAMDVAAWGITVNTIAPGALETSRAVLSLDPDLDVRQAAQEMLYLNVQRLFVEFDGALVGVISQTDIVGAVATSRG